MTAHRSPTARRPRRLAGGILALALLLAPPLAAQRAKDPEAQRLEREILKQLIEINTSDSAGHTPEAARAMADRLIAAGMPAADVRVLGYEPRHQSLVARYRGSAGGRKPILLMAHLDVVDARREDWSTDPFQFVEQGGWYYGRGTSDVKDGAAMLVANFIRYRKEGFVPDRDLILVLTADEETTGESIRWLVEEHRDLVDADFALNTDGGGGDYRNGKPIRFNVQAAEKVYESFVLEVRNKGGHSSRPVPDNAIYRLARGLDRLAGYQFPVRLNEVTRAFFERGAAAETPALAADMRLVARTGNALAAKRLSVASPYYNSVLHTTCVATRLFAGHADNALPQLARATVNCRIEPDQPVDSVEAILRRVVADTAIRFSRVAEAHPSPASPLRKDVMGAVEALAGTYWPGVPVVPEMSTGASDGLYTRNAGIPTYGVGAVFDDINDSRAHGRDERVGVKEYHQAAEYWYELVKRLAGGRPAS
jgi:acetylornithine deacetylase/succinyl-diaminopimelate desuccinylase-like protein